MNRARWLLLGVIFGLGSTGLHAQDWGTSWFPLLFPTANEFPVISLAGEYSKMAPYEAPYLNDAALQAAAGVTVRGSWLAGIRFRAPGLSDDWRYDVWMKATQEKRFGYYGLGNATTYDKMIADQNSTFYRVDRRLYAAQAEVDRRLVGPLSIALAGRIQYTEFVALSGPSVFASEFSGPVTDTDGSIRLSFRVDTRNKEYNTQRGVLVEAGAKAASGGDGYGWLYGSASGFVSPRDGTVLALRVAGGGATGTPPLSQAFEFNTFEEDRITYGGRFSNRGYADSRWGGSGVVIGNLDIRHDLLNLGDFGGITLIAFADVGRVYQDEDFTLDNLHLGAGGGVAIRVLRSNIWTLNFSGGEDGFKFLVTWGWVF